MNKPPPYKPTLNQMQAQSQAKLQAQQIAYINAAQMAQSAQGVQHVGHWYATQTPPCGPTGATYTTYVGTNGTLCYAYHGASGTMHPYPIQGTGGAGISIEESRPSFKIEECGVRAGEIIAYRAWKLHGDSLYLRSMFVDYIWQPDKPQKDPERHLNDYGGNGFHAFKTLEKCKQEYGYIHGFGLGHVYGEVALWGQVIEHKRGYRAECARVTRIMEVHENIVGGGLRRLFGTRTIDKLRKLYEVQE